MRALLPGADVRIHLDVPAEVAVARKPDDLLGEHAVRRQLAAYEYWLDRFPGTARLDSTQSPTELAAGALALTAGNTGHKNRTSR